MIIQIAAGLGGMFSFNRLGGHIDPIARAFFESAGVEEVQVEVLAGES